MQRDVVLLVKESDNESFQFIRGNLQRVGVPNEIMRFTGYQELLNFLFTPFESSHRKPQIGYILILCLQQGDAESSQLLQRIKTHEELKKMPVIVFAPEKDVKGVENYLSLGCNVYLAKPALGQRFAEEIQRVGRFLEVVEIPKIDF